MDCIFGQSTLIPGRPFRENVITPLSPQAIGIPMAAVSTAAPASATWQVSSGAFYVPVILQEGAIITNFFTYNGAAASGNIDIGLYREDNVKVVTKGSTAMSGTATVQTFDTTDTYAPAGRYYLAMAVDNTTAEFFMSTASVPLLKLFGCAREAAAFALPTTITPATIATHTLVPMFGMTTRSFV